MFVKSSASFGPVVHVLARQVPVQVHLAQTDRVLIALPRNRRH